MNDNYYNSSPEEKRKRDEDMYQKFIILGIVPLFIYLMWPFLFNTNKVEAQAQVVEERVEKVAKKAEARPNIDESTPNQGQTKAAPVVPPTKTKPPKKINKVQPGTIKKRQPAPKQNNAATFSLTYNAGDKIEHIVQGMGWKGTVQSKQNGSYTVKITEVVLNNDQKPYLPGNNPCFGGQPIGRNVTNKVITIPGSCIHAK